MSALAGRFVLKAEDGSEFPLDGSITVGRHLDNDVVAAGEDVKDFHVRIQLDERGPKMHLLPNAVVRLNDVTVDADGTLLPNDVIAIGQETFRLIQDVDEAQRMDGWALYGFDGAAHIDVQGEVTIGRHPSSDILLTDGHVSRHHARLIEFEGTLWVEDFGSANGTFVNGRRIKRASRLLHGDELTFDVRAYQVIAQGADLTPVRPSDEPMYAEDKVTESPTLTEASPAETTEMAAAPLLEAASIERPLEPGCFLIGLTGALRGRREILEVGQYVVGRHRDTDIVIDDDSVSVRHAEIGVRAEGCYVSDLMSTNGVSVNGREVQAHALVDGDVVAFGNAQWVYFQVDAKLRRERSLWWVAAAAVLVAIVAAVVAGIGALL